MPNVTTRLIQPRPVPTAVQSDRERLPAPADNHVQIDDAAWIELGAGVRGRYGQCRIASLLRDPDSVRQHPKRQITKLARSINATGALAPLIVDENLMLLAGHARLAACQELGWTEVPMVQISGASAAQKKAFSISDNRIAEDARWDREKLADLMPDLSKLIVEADLSLDVLGFDTTELDTLSLDFEASPASPDDRIEAEVLGAPRVLQQGDHISLGSHALIVGDARDPATLDRLCQGVCAAAVITDPPYNVMIRNVVGRGRVQHGEFAFASGEMSSEEYRVFLATALGNAKRVSQPGALHYVFIDRKHVRDLLDVGDEVYDAFVDLIVWNKTNAGQGGLYRSQHELICLFRVGEEQHRDNVQMGRFGRNRSNVWTYPGVNTFRGGRMADLAAHPTVKPHRLIADAIQDCTQRGEVVLDLFGGSGTTLLAADTVGRRALLVECEAQYADVTVRRWQAMTGRDAVHQESGLTFDELAVSRASPQEA